MRIGRACPPIERVGRLVFIARAAGFLDQQKATSLIEAARLPIALEGLQVQVIEGALCDAQQLGADAAPVSVRPDIQLIDPAGPECAHTDDC